MENDHYVVASFDDEKKQAMWMNEKYRSGYDFVAMVSTNTDDCITVLMEKKEQK